MRLSTRRVKNLWRRGTMIVRDTQSGSPECEKESRVLSFEAAHFSLYFKTHMDYRSNDYQRVAWSYQLAFNDRWIWGSFTVDSQL